MIFDGRIFSCYYYKTVKNLGGSEIMCKIAEDMANKGIKSLNILGDHGVGSTDHFLKFLYYTSFLTPHDLMKKMKYVKDLFEPIN